MSLGTIAIYKDVFRTGRGADRATAALANHLAEQGYAVHLFAQEEPTSVTFSRAVSCHCVKPRKHPLWKRFVNKLLLRSKAGEKLLRLHLPRLDILREFSRNLRERIAESGAELVISAGTNECVELTYGGGKLNAPLVQMFHVYPPTCFGKNKYQRVARLKAALRYVDTCQVLLPSHAQTLKPYLSAPIVAIGNALSLPMEELPAVETREKVIVYVAYFNKNKGHAALLEAFAMLKGAEAWTLELYGSGTPEWEQRLRQQVERLHLTERVRFCGVRDDLYHRLTTAGICAYPSYTEGFGLALVEAMWCGLPCVGFREAPGVCDLIRHEETGLLAPTFAPADFAEQLQRLVDHPELRAELGERASRAVRNAYAQEVVWRAWDELIRRAFGGAGAASEA